jgi:hypothetical protein
MEKMFPIIWIMGNRKKEDGKKRVERESKRCGQSQPLVVFTTWTRFHFSRARQHKLVPTLHT